MGIPSFFRLENMKSNIKEDKMFLLVKEYMEIFGDHPMTEPSSYTEKEWIEILEECIRDKKTTWEVIGDEYDPEADY